MTIDDLEAAQPDIEAEDNEVTCAYTPPKQEADDEFLDPRVEKLAERILRHFFGRNHTQDVKKGRKGLRMLLEKAFETAEVFEEDLNESLELLEDGLLLFERVLSRKPELFEELSSHMEELADHLGKWNMGNRDTIDTIKSQFD
jgi:hypothetical protein